VEAADIVASQLTKFGINVKPDIQNGNIFFDDQDAGDYPVSLHDGDNFILPYYIYNFYDTHDNYAVNAAGKLYKTTSAKSEQNIPTNLNVPGLGTVDPAKVDWSLLFNRSTAQERSITFELAKITNYELPYISLFGQYASNVVNTSQWTWPSLKNPVWEGNAYGIGFVPLFQSLGLMKPR
jgi:hypothetical protein